MYKTISAAFFPALKYLYACLMRMRLRMRMRKLSYTFIQSPVRLYIGTGMSHISYFIESYLICTKVSRVACHFVDIKIAALCRTGALKANDHVTV